MLKFTKNKKNTKEADKPRPTPVAIPLVGLSSSSSNSSSPWHYQHDFHNQLRIPEYTEHQPRPRQRLLPIPPMNITPTVRRRRLPETPPQRSRHLPMPSPTPETNAQAMRDRPPSNVQIAEIIEILRDIRRQEYLRLGRQRSQSAEYWLGVETGLKYSARAFRSRTQISRIPCSCNWPQTLDKIEKIIVNLKSDKAKEPMTQNEPQAATRDGDSDESRTRACYESARRIIEQYRNNQNNHY